MEYYAQVIRFLHYIYAAKNIRGICFILVMSKRLLLVGACICLISYCTVVTLLSFAFGNYLRSLKIIPFEIYQKEPFEDPGVKEMRALLRGEDCYNHDLHQHQLLPPPHPEYRPRREMYLAPFYYRILRYITREHESLKQQGGEFYEVMNYFFTFFDNELIHHITSYGAVNQRN